MHTNTHRTAKPRTWPRVTVMIALLGLAVPAAAQIYQCPDVSGRTVIQQAPCIDGQEMNVRSFGGHAAPQDSTADLGAVDSPPSRAEQLRASVEASQTTRRRRDLNDRLVPSARAAMFRHRDECQQEIADLRHDQYRYVQNLWGKTHAAQRAGESASVAASCDTKDRELTAEYQRLKSECQTLGACAGMTP